VEENTDHGVLLFGEHRPGRNTYQGGKEKHQPRRASFRGTPARAETLGEWKFIKLRKISTIWLFFFARLWYSWCLKCT